MSPFLAHSKVAVPEPQKRALVATLGSDSGVFCESLLDSVAAQVKEDSLVSSSLAVSKALSARSGAKPSTLRPCLWLALPVSVLLGKALPPLRAWVEVSALRAVRGRLLPQNLRVFAGRSHHLA